MSDSTDSILERKLGRDEFLKLAALAGGAGLLAAPGGAQAARALTTARARTATGPPISKEPGQLQVFEWAGYEVPGLYQPYLKAGYPKPKFTFLTSDEQALAKVAAGFRPDVVHPCVGLVRNWGQTGFVQPWDTRLLSNFKDLNPAMVKAGQVGGKQYFIPADWGFSSVLYRADQVQPNEQSWNLLYDERYAGKISWWDSLINLVVAGYVLGFRTPYNLTKAQLDTAKTFLISKKHVARNYWTSETDMQNDFAAGNIWITYAWPGDFAAMKGKSLDVVYMHPKEKPLSWVCGFVLIKGTKNYYHAHKYVDAWSSVQSAKWLENNYAYGEANLKAQPSSVDLLRELQLGHPSAVQEPNAHMDRYIPNRSVYEKVWDEVKAA